MTEKQYKANRMAFMQSLIGRWMILNFRRRVRESGYFVAARQLRKWGVPLNVARMILLGATT